VSNEKVLIVEDESEIGELIRFHTERAGFRPTVVGTGRKALEHARRDPPDAVLLDLMLPDVDGLDVCRQLKWQDETSDVPIIIVSAKGHETDVVTGIELGADDYVTKPFSPRILIARLRNVLRRVREPVHPNGQSTGGLDFSGTVLTIDSERHEVRINDDPIELTVTEFGILRYLAAKPGFVRTRDQIISAVHGSTTVLSSRTIDVHVTALRRKLGALGEKIETVRGVGYRLSEPAATEEP